MTETILRTATAPKSILVVEDETVAALSIRTVLVAEGHTVEIAADGEQALTMFSAGRYDLVITDFKLAKLDGLELAEVIKQVAPAIPIILITAYADKIGATTGSVSNVDVVVNKPFSVAQLQGALQKVLQPA